MSNVVMTVNKKAFPLIREGFFVGAEGVEPPTLCL